MILGVYDFLCLFALLLCLLCFALSSSCGALVAGFADFDFVFPLYAAAVFVFLFVAVVACDYS